MQNIEAKKYLNENDVLSAWKVLLAKKIKEIKTIKIEDGSYRKIKMIDQTKEVGSGGFKRDVVTTEQYPTYFCSICSRQM
jgi:hypothetical protein